MKRTKQPKNKTKPTESFLKVNNAMLAHYGCQIAILLAHLIDMESYFTAQGMLYPDGSFWQKHKQITERTGLSDHQIRQCKNQLRKDGIIIVRQKHFPNREHYKINHNTLETVVNGASLEKIKDIYPQKIKARPSNNLRDEGAKIKAYNNTKQINKNENNNTHLCEEVDDDKIKIKHFVLFWKNYPKKNDQGKAKTEWNKLCSKVDRPEWRIVRQAIREQKETPRWKNTQFIPFPATWIKESRWLDDPKEMKEIKIQQKNNDNKNSIGSRRDGSIFNYDDKPVEIIN